MHAKRHALLAKRLITACGGLEEAAENCRLERSRLADFSNPEAGAFMPADVMADLEAYAGEPIYSRAIAGSRPAVENPQGLLIEVMEGTEAAAELQALTRRALEDGQLTPAERLALEAKLLAFEDQVREIAAALSREGATAAQGGQG